MPKRPRGTVDEPEPDPVEEREGEEEEEEEEGQAGEEAQEAEEAEDADSESARIAAEEDGDESEEEEEAAGSSDGSPAAASSSAPAVAPKPSKEVVEESDDEGDEGDDKLPKSRRGAITQLNRVIRGLRKERKATNQKLAEYKIALGNSNHALRAADVDIPDSAKVTGGTTASGDGAETQRAVVLQRSSQAEDSVPAGELPYRLELCNLPDTSTIVKGTKFPLKGSSFPHGVCQYQRTGEKLAPHVEQRRPIVLTWQLVNRLAPDTACDENDICPGIAHPMVFYKLMLVYADDDEEVTMENLDGSAGHIDGISTPNILGAAQERMKGGSVTFKFHLNAFASHTKPLHRTFRFKLVCTHDRLKTYNSMHASTVDFYSVSRIRLGKGKAEE
jgi:hypothetical protein